MPYQVAPSQFRTLLEARQVAQSCVRCDLSRTRQLVAFGEGAQNAKLMLIGEGPGAEEDLAGRPFVGRAGKLLTQWLESIGLSREDVWISNIVRCRPCSPKNGKLVNRQPHPTEIEACKIYMDAEISFVRPKLILCLGAVAAETFNHKPFRLTEERGKWFEGPQGSLVMPTFHPAYVLRHPGGPASTILAQVNSDLGEVRNRYCQGIA